MSSEIAMKPAAGSGDALRASRLRATDNQAAALFQAIESRLIRPGVSERALGQEICTLASDLFGVSDHWHRSTIRSGPNTLCAYQDDPPDRVIGEDDIVIVDLGPVFGAWEADFGRTFVLGRDQHKMRLRDALAPMWHRVKAFYESRPTMAAEDLYDFAVEAARGDGWSFGASIAGHTIGPYRDKDPKMVYIKRGSRETMDSTGNDGFKRHWILEIHLREPGGKYGGFYEQLLTA
ncbi:Peptidase M24, structural domain protein [Moelleriella libera RCEF 2490]|uniref:Peptidase M24, structural domain protein n=1 Tax=Moelleriella libera RCEF 2490 TaxID=1081109 RepID=A0A168EU11_9HYPO|nr:Peptidase M24, structural domain protein [Moelleriella libera RCEF 2490]